MSSRNSRNRVVAFGFGLNFSLLCISLEQELSRVAKRRLCFMGMGFVIENSVEKCRILSKPISRKKPQSLCHLDTLRLGLVFRRLRKNDKLKHVATARPLYLRGVERGVSIRRGHPILCRPTKLCQESIPAHRHPDPLTLSQESQDVSLSEGLQWAVTPKLTMIAGRQLSIEDASGAKLPSRLQQ